MEEDEVLERRKVRRREERWRANRWFRFLLGDLRHFEACDGASEKDYEALDSVLERPCDGMYPPLEIPDPTPQYVTRTRAHVVPPRPADHCWLCRAGSTHILSEHVCLRCTLPHPAAVEQLRQLRLAEISERQHDEKFQARHYKGGFASADH